MKKPPLDEVDSDPETLKLELKFEQVDIGLEYAIKSKQGTLKTLPFFLGDDDDKSENRKLPSQDTDLPRHWMLTTCQIC